MSTGKSNASLRNPVPIARKFYLSVLILFICLQAGSRSWAEEKPIAQRPCVRQDLQGLWKAVIINPFGHEAPLFEPFFSKYQCYQFNADGTLTYFMVMSNNEVSRGVAAGMLKIPPTSKYQLDQYGWLTILTAGNPEDRSACTYVLEDYQNEDGAYLARKGDIILTHYDQKGLPILLRSFRHISSVDEVFSD